MRIEVIEGDAASIAADVLAIKYAQARHGLDEYVAERLRAAGHPDEVTCPKPGEFRLLTSPQGIAASSVLVVGVKPLEQFEYPQIRAFARKVLSCVSSARPDARRLLVTVHGPGYGLDEAEAFESEIAGFLDALECCSLPNAFELITIVERNRARAERLHQILDTLVPDRSAELYGGSWHDVVGAEVAERLRVAGYESGAKAHAFVAMPFTEEMDDVYHYGILNAIKAAGLLCERADLSAFTGDILSWVKDRIKSASLVIAELTGANPNVYLEVGFAWGCGIPTVLIARGANELRFDVRGQRCLMYSRIKELEEKLSAELLMLSAGRGEVSPSTKHAPNGDEFSGSDATVFRVEMSPSARLQQDWEELQLVLTVCRQIDQEFRERPATAMRQPRLPSQFRSSRARFEQIFRRVTGLPIHHYLRRCRVEQVRIAVAQGQKTANVAATFGYGDESHMVREFRRVTGSSLREIRRRSSDP